MRFHFLQAEAENIIAETRAAIATLQRYEQKAGYVHECWRGSL
jgi:hypothetical protein